MDSKALLNYRSLKTLLKEATIADLDKILANLEALKAEILQRVEALRLEQEEREAKLKLLTEKMGELSVSAQEFLSEIAPSNV